ncbi:MAG: hypothetical protein H0U19_07835, partial [Acidobacteria bacterium]|nr:hypothetical protein [Acidobacteriota bacterium]
MIVAVSVAVIAWGALAFGAPYPWAYTPLLIGCAVAGALGLSLHRTKPFPRVNRAAIIALLCV